MALGRKRKTHTLIGKGIVLGDHRNRIRNIWLKDAERKGHLFCFGTTRIGKTKLAESMICQDIEKGYSVLLVDPKGDIALFSKIAQAAFAACLGKQVARPVGQEGKHLSLRLSDGRETWGAIAFSQGHRYPFRSDRRLGP